MFVINNYMEFFLFCFCNLQVRRSLETLSMLIHDRRAGFAQPATEVVVDPASAVLEPELDASVPIVAASPDILSD